MFRNGEVSEEAFADHVSRLGEGFAEIERLLADDRSWLCGEQLSMADILWGVKVVRISEAGYPFATTFPRIQTWFDRVRTRPSFKEAIGRDQGVTSKFLRARGSTPKRRDSPSAAT